MPTGRLPQLDRMAIEEVGLNPEKLAAAIHRQLGMTGGPVPVCEIALALDIVKIRQEPLTNLEGVLLTDPQRSNGAILVNARSSPERRRFSVGHELGHFLISSHRPLGEEGFRCSSGDMAGNQEASALQRRQESEANSFAINLLAPLHLSRKYLTRSPDLEHALAMAADLELSKEAAARRYVELHREDLAVIFGRQGRVLYWAASQAFPALAPQKDIQIPTGMANCRIGEVSEMEDAEPTDWLRNPAGVALAVQTLAQQNGYSITLLHAEEAESEGDLDDTFGRFPRK